MVVVYTMADSCRYEPEIEAYIQNDPFGKLTTAPAHEKLPAVRLTDYLPPMLTQSGRLRSFTELAVPEGRAFLTMAAGLGYDLEFAATSDRGDAPATNEYEGRPRAPVRVIDPLLLSFGYELREPPRFRFAVVLDGSDNPGPIFNKNLPPAIHALLRKRGEVTVYYLGHARAESNPGQQPPNEKSRVARLRLVGPILDKLDKDDATARRSEDDKWRAVVLANGPVLDLQDFNRGWGNRLLLVRTDNQTTDERWEMLTRYRETDSAETAINPLLEALRTVRT
jgi:hypothetical protein